MCCVSGIALCASGMGFVWLLCGSVYVRFGPLLASAGLPWPSLAACTAGHPAETQFRKELPDRGTGTKPAHVIDFVAAGSWGRSWCPVRLWLNVGLGCSKTPFFEHFSGIASPALGLGCLPRGKSFGARADLFWHGGSGLLALLVHPGGPAFSRLFLNNGDG